MLCIVPVNFGVECAEWVVGLLVVSAGGFRELTEFWFLAGVWCCRFNLCAEGTLMLGSLIACRVDWFVLLCVILVIRIFDMVGWYILLFVFDCVALGNFALRCSLRC